MLRHVWILLAALAMLTVGCEGWDGFGLGQGQGDPDDDDVADDDDDDDTEEPLPDWANYELEIWFEAVGGTEGGDSNVYVTQTFYSEDGEFVCGKNFTFRADYTYGTNQSDEFFEYADEVLTFTEGEVTSDDCDEDDPVTGDEQMEEWEWVIHPLIFVSCDQVMADEDLGSIGITTGDFIWQGEWGDGTFSFFCDKIGPAATYFFHTGDHEAVWLLPGHPGDLDAYEKKSKKGEVEVEFNYFEPLNPENVEVWYFYGFSVAEDTNKNEPTDGLEGTYEIIPLWPWIYDVDGALGGGCGD